MAMLDAYEHGDDGGERGSGYCWWSGLPGVPVSALRKDLVMERPWNIQCSSKPYGSSLTN